MMMKAAPGSALEVVQAQVILGALKVLLNVPAGTTQPQAAGPAGRLMKMGQDIMIRLGFAGGPVHDQPNSFQVVVTFPQLMLQINLAPSQAGPTRLAVGGLPRARLPLLSRKGGGNLRQSLSGWNSRGDIAPYPLSFRRDGMGPSLVSATRLQK